MARNPLDLPATKKGYSEDEESGDLMDAAETTKDARLLPRVMSPPSLEIKNLHVNRL